MHAHTSPIVFTAGSYLYNISLFYGLKETCISTVSPRQCRDFLIRVSSALSFSKKNVIRLDMFEMCFLCNKKKKHIYTCVYIYIYMYIYIYIYIYYSPNKSSCWGPGYVVRGPDSRCRIQICARELASVASRESRVASRLPKLKIRKLAAAAAKL